MTGLCGAYSISEKRGLAENPHAFVVRTYVNVATSAQCAKSNRAKVVTLDYLLEEIIRRLSTYKTAAHGVTTAKRAVQSLTL